MQYRYADEGSPLAAFLGTFYNIVATRKLVASVNMVFKGQGSWLIFVNDLTMLFEEGTTMGCRTPWVRRVLVPVLGAQAELQKSVGDDAHRAKMALAELVVLKNADDALLATCTAWLTERFLTAPVDHGSAIIAADLKLNGPSTSGFDAKGALDE